MGMGGNGNVKIHSRSFDQVAVSRGGYGVGRISDVILRRTHHLVLGWVTVTLRASIFNCQLNLLPAAGQEMSAGQSAIKLCDRLGSKGHHHALSLIPLVL